MSILYVVATPIGNLSDISERVLDTLRSVDLIAAEDTRNTLRLLNYFSIKKRLVSYHEHNEKSRLDEFLGILSEGKSIALVSDAGTPCISDPGYHIVKACVENNIKVVPIPGVSAVTAALSVSGLDIEKFTFYGFLSRNNKLFNASIKEMSESDVDTFVLYESPKRIEDLLKSLDSGLENPHICLFNDLTKLHERVYRGSAKQVLFEISENPDADKGEYTVVVKRLGPKKESQTLTEISPEGLLAHYLSQGLNMKDSMKALLSDSRYKKKEIYAASLRLKELLKGGVSWQTSE